MYSKIIVPLDGSELAECVLPHVEAIAKGCEVPEVAFLYVVERSDSAYWDFTRKDKENATNYLEGKVKSFTDKGLSAQFEVILKIPAEGVAESITDYATKKGADLIVIATHGRSGISRWVYGSVADRILRSSCIPVLMARAPGCVPGI